MSEYDYNYPVQQPAKANGISVTALILGIVCFFCNPCSLVAPAAVICGIIGLATSKDRPKGMAIAGLILGACGILAQLLFDIIGILFSGGLTFFI